MQLRDCIFFVNTRHVGAKSAPLRFKAVPFGAALKLRSAPLLLLSNSNPLRWASSWLLVHDDRLHLFYQHMTNPNNPNLFPIGDGFGLFVFFVRHKSTCFRNGGEQQPRNTAAICRMNTPPGPSSRVPSPSVTLSRYPPPEPAIIFLIKLGRTQHGNKEKTAGGCGRGRLRGLRLLRENLPPVRHPRMARHSGTGRSGAVRGLRQVREGVPRLHH